MATAVKKTLSSPSRDGWHFSGGEEHFSDGEDFSGELISAAVAAMAPAVRRVELVLMPWCRPASTE